MIPDQVFVYILIAFGVIYFLHQFSEWKNAGTPNATLLSKKSVILISFYSLFLWLIAITVAIFYWDVIAGSPLNIASFLVSVALGNVGLILHSVCRCKNISG